MRMPLIALLALAPAGVTAQSTDIFTTAARAGGFDTLVSLVAAADLDEVLEGKGDFTVFAPTDEAFAKLPAETLASLRTDEGRAQLVEILKYHVLPQRVSVPLKPPSHRITEAATLQGAKVSFARDGRAVSVNDASIQVRNIDCSNGYIHSIDSVLLPPPKVPSLAELLQKDERFSTLLAALDAAELTAAVAGGDGLTVFAPTNEAFAALPKGALDALLRPENKGRLAAILKDHVLPEKRTARELARRERVEPLSGRKLDVAIRGGGIEIAGARVLENDRIASNGIVHVLGAVILPADSGDSDEIADVVEIRATWKKSVDRDGIRAKKLIVRCSGGGSVTLTNVDAKEIVTAISGGGNVSIAGVAGRHQAQVNGGAELAARDLVTEVSDVVVNGGGDAEVNATRSLNCKVRSGGALRYVDRGAEIHREVSPYATLAALDAPQRKGGRRGH